jgi:forespore regulator of the sigma-K checkpoint
MTLTFVILLVFTYHISNAEKNVNKSKIDDAQQNKSDEETFEVLGPLTLQVVLQRQFLDGEISEEVFDQTIWSMVDFWASYEDWQLIDQQKGKIIFRKNIHDISPLLKANGYFGIDIDGRVTIFNGMPSDEQVIQSFFQIDIEKLESTLKDELKEGIVIKTKGRFEQVYNLLKQYEVN